MRDLPRVIELEVTGTGTHTEVFEGFWLQDCGLSI